MELIIAEIADKFTKKMIEIVAEGGILCQIEGKALREAKTFASQVVGAYAESVDRAIVADRSARKKAGYQVERCGDERRGKSAARR